MYHHSVPAIIQNLKNSDDVRYVIRNGFLISGSILLIIPLTGCMAFGKELGAGKGLQYYNFDFEGKINFIYYFVSFYVFLNIAAFSVYIIVIRTNILKLVNPSIDPLKFSSKILSYP